MDGWMARQGSPWSGTDGGRDRGCKGKQDATAPRCPVPRCGGPSPGSGRQLPQLPQGLVPAALPHLLSFILYLLSFIPSPSALTTPAPRPRSHLRRAPAPPLPPPALSHWRAGPGASASPLPISAGRGPWIGKRTRAAIQDGC